jgi:hypothetical protein
MEPVKLLGRAAGTAAQAVRHPISSAAYAAGMARGLAGAAVHGVLVRGREEHRTSSPPVPSQTGADSAADSTTSGSTTSAAAEIPTPQRVPKPVPPPDAFDDMVVIEAGPPHESFATEPKAVSRESAHGGPASDAEIDAWLDEAMAEGDDIGVETPVGTTGVSAGHNPDTAEADLQQPGTEPLLDPSVMKAVRSEAEILRKAADPDKG